MKLGLLTVIVMAMWTGMLGAAEPASVLLEKGIYAEETLGDMDGAIRIYKQIVQENAANRPSVAQAQYRLGRAYLKKKQAKEAAEAFEQLIQQFPDQKTLVAEAKKRLAETRAAMGDSAEPAAAGPKLLKTHPATFADDVDPALDKITATFGQKMKDGSWSWTGGGETFPQVTGKISYDAARTVCTLPVKLEPGKVYWIGINSPSNRNFQTADGQPMAWYIILFATRSADGKATPIPQQMLDRAKTINNAAGKAAPVVVKTAPAPLADSVPATLDKITVTFDQPMKDGSWSWTGGGETFPQITGQISYDAAKTTCTLPVKLEPGKLYVIGINGGRFRNFQTAAGVPAKTHLLVFSTASTEGKPTPIADDWTERVKATNGDPAGGR